MKKIISAIIASIFIGTFAHAENLMGIKISAANMDASGSHTTNSASSGGGGSAVTAAGNADFHMASVFVEKSTEVNGMDLSLGLDIIPFEAEVDSLGGGDGFDATVSVSNVITAYIQPTINTGGPLSLFIKGGYTMGDVEITDISRQATTAGTASTDGDTSKTLEGFVYGVGVQANTDFGFVRLEGTYTDFDEISHTNSNSKVVKADAEMTLISISFGRSF